MLLRIDDIVSGGKKKGNAPQVSLRSTESSLKLTEFSLKLTECSLKSHISETSF
jgi:hypothetical protein